MKTLIDKIGGYEKALSLFNEYKEYSPSISYCNYVDGELVVIPVDREALRKELENYKAA